MNQTQLDEIRKRRHPITEGYMPWKYHPYGDKYEVVVQAAMFSQIEFKVCAVVNQRVDAEFIANAPADIDALLAYIAELESANLALNEILDKLLPTQKSYE